MLHNVRYAGFTVRLIASLIDTVVLAVPIGIVIYLLSDGQWMNFEQYTQMIQMALRGDIAVLQQRPQVQMQWEIVFELIMLTVVIIFWKRWAGATPGKKMLGIEVVSFDGAPELTNKQMITRSIGYIVSILPLMIGFFMVAFREDKRALHDLLADTAVIYKTS